MEVKEHISEKLNNFLVVDDCVSVADRPKNYLKKWLSRLPIFRMFIEIIEILVAEVADSCRYRQPGLSLE